MGEGHYRERDQTARGFVTRSEARIGSVDDFAVPRRNVISAVLGSRTWWWTQIESSVESWDHGPGILRLCVVLTRAMGYLRGHFEKDTRTDAPNSEL